MPALTPTQLRNFQLAKAFMALSDAHLTPSHDNPTAGFPEAVAVVSNVLSEAPSIPVLIPDGVQPIVVATVTADGTWGDNLLYDVATGFILNGECIMERLSEEGIYLTDEDVRIQARMPGSNEVVDVEVFKFSELTMLRLPRKLA